MRLLNYIYYCSYRFFLKTSFRPHVDAAPGVFLALTVAMHGLTLYFLFTVATGRAMIPDTEGRLAFVATMVLLLAIFYWYYVWKGNAARVIASFEKRGNDRKYALLGAIMLIETALLPLAVTFFL